MAPLLEVREVTRSYGSIRAVDGLTFDVAAGEAFGLLGPNGAGKSTTMMMICGLLSPDSGSIQLEGRPLDRRLPASRQRMGVVPQDLAIYPDLTGRENLRFFASLYHVDGTVRTQRVDEALDQVGLSGRADDLVETYSGGMKRRLNFAAAVMHRPALLILDEPTVGVDPQSRSHLMDCVRALQDRGTAVIYASHYMEEVQTLCSRAAIVDHGRMVACGTMPELLRQIPLEVELRLGHARLSDDMLSNSGVSVSHDGEETVMRIAATASGSETALNRQVTDVLSLLAERSISVRSIRTQEPNLERLFLKLTGHGLRD
jgi:ABC-2 type transport system ATP-binding protein